ncbi:MAG TPA: Rad52/Rad22 family DNA repair protein [Gemmatimonadaceae bacterium]
MIARHEAQREQTTDVWAKLAAPLPPGVTAWRQDGRPITRDGRFFARFVSYIDANTVRERLDSVVPGEWNLTLELLPQLAGTDDDQLSDQNRCAFKARLQILGVVREDVGTGKDYKQASTDAFKRVAVRFGIGHELYAMGQNWVQMDGDGKYAKPIEDPQAAYDRRLARTQANAATRAASSEEEGSTANDDAPALELSRAPIVGDVPPCPKCGGRMWDNRLGKRNPKAPDFKCRDRNCDGVIWPAKPAKRGAAKEESESAAAAPAPAGAQLGSDEIPF